MAAPSDELICPACQSENVEPARARGLDHLVMLIGSYPFQCVDCGERFRSTASRRSEPDQDFPATQSTEAVCPNCHHATTIQLTQGERDMAVDEGWVVSCPGCRALFAFITPTEISAGQD